MRTSSIQKSQVAPWLIATLIFLFSLFTFITPSQSRANDDLHVADSHAIQSIRAKLTLTKEEKQWLSDHPSVKIGIDAGYAPYSFLNKDKHFIGIAPDFISVLSKSLGINFEPVPDLTWPEIINGAKNKTLDVVATAVITQDRLAFLEFSRIYIPTPLVIMTRYGEEESIGSADNLSGKTVALVEEYSSSKRVLKEHPEIIQHPVASPLEGLQAVATGEAEAYIGVLGVNYYLAQQHGLSNLSIAARYDLKTNGQRFAVRNDWPELRSILDKALDLLTAQDNQKIMEKWIPIPVGGSTVNSSDAPPIDWTTAETDWLKEHPEITIGIMNAWPPMDYVDEQGRPQGIGTGFIDALNQRLGGALKIVPGEWADVYEGVKNKKLDALTGITPRKNREPFFNFTESYVNVPHAIFKRVGDDYSVNLNSLSGKTISAEKGFFIHDVIKEKYPSIRSIEFENTSDAIDALVKGKVDAYIGNRAVAMYIIRNELISNLEEHGKIKETSSINAIGVRKDWPLLRDILQKALDNITNKERFSILQDWVEPLQSKDSSSVELTAAEWSWLDQHDVIRVAGDSHWAPVEFLSDNGSFKGISVEYIDIISSMLGIRFEYVPSSNWVEAAEKVKQRELDIFAAAAATPNREKYTNFTTPYLSLPAMVFTPKDVPYISSLDKLEGRKVSVVRGYAITEFIRRGGWDIELVEVDTISQGLQALQNRETFAYIGNILSTSYAIRETGFSNIRVSGQTPYNIYVSMGVRSDWPILTSILNKTLKKIHDTQGNQISTRWIGLQVKEAPDYSLFWKALLAGVAILLLFLAWNAALQKRNTSQSLEITQQNNILRRSRASLSNAQRIAKLGSWEWVIDNNEFKWSDELYRILGQNKVGMSASYSLFINAIHPSDRASVESAFEESCKNTTPLSLEARVVRPDGSIRNIHLQGEVAFDESRNTHVMSGTALDITQRKEIEEKLFREANYSQLTKQPNRYYMLNRIDHNIQKEEPFALLMVDMINIKRINDSLGFEAGDKIIKEAALRLDSLVNRSRFVAHLGGGQFLFLAERTHHMVTEILISHILSSFKQPFDIKDENITQNASVGIALFPTDGGTAEELMSKAHVAANQAKRTGRLTYIYFTEKYNKEAHQLLHMENLLRQVIDKKELSIFFQPKVDAKSGRFLGAEALLRWFNDDLGTVPPDQFIPLAEETEIILPIGRWVIEESCRQACSWREAGHTDFTVAINMSPKQFLDKDIVPFIKSCLEKYAIEGSQVEIEVTEGLFIQRSEPVDQQIHALKKAGISLALDDFGTGYSSLQYLRNYPFDTLKIDRSFVTRLPESKDDVSLVRAITAMGRALGMKIVAEGVENQSQADFLNAEGCDIFQGYLFGKPMAEEDFMQWLKQARH